MLQFHAESFFWMINTLNAIDSLNSMQLDDSVIPDKERIDLIQIFGRMAETCLELELTFTQKHGVRMVNALNRDTPPTCGEFSAMIKQFRERMGDELSTQVFMRVKKINYHEQKNLFGEVVTNNLPQLTLDIEESGKCLAFGRSTASVFHLMRIMELGLQELGQRLGVTLAREKVWQVILDQTNKTIKLLPETMPEDKAKKSLYAQSASQLYNVKWAWRNPVMHPKESYTEEEVEDIFLHVRTFIRHLANQVLV